MTQWTRVRHADTGGEAIIPLDSLPAQQARGFEPLGDPAPTRFELLVQADQELADAAEAAKAAAAEPEPVKASRPARTPRSGARTADTDAAASTDEGVTTGG
jgi:hypothetical protein